MSLPADGYVMWAVLGLGLALAAGIWSGLNVHTHLSLDQGGTLTLVGQPGQCRLILSGGNLKLIPFNGNSLRIGGNYVLVPSAGVTLGPGGLTPGTTYYIYVYGTTGSLALEASTTGYSTDSDGNQSKTGDSTRLLVGMARPLAGPTFADNYAQRLVRSWFQDPKIAGSISFTIASSTASGTLTELSTNWRIQFLVWAGEWVEACFSGTVDDGGFGVVSYSAIGFDGGASDGGSQTGPGRNGVVLAHGLTSNLSEGFHFATPMGRNDSGGGIPTTWLGNATAGERCAIRLSTGGAF